LLSHAVHGLLDSGCVDRIVVAGPARHRAVHGPGTPQLASDPRVTVVPTGSDGDPAGPGAMGLTPLRAALAAADAGPDDVVLVHDVARAFVPAAVVREVVDAVAGEAVSGGAVAAVPVRPVADTVKVVDDDGIVRATRDRSHLRHVQTPLALRLATLTDALTRDPAAEVTSLLADLAALGGEIRTVHGDPHGMRIRTPFDVAVIEALLTTENPA